MNIQEYFEGMKNIQNNIINFIDSNDDAEEHFQNLNIIFKDQKIFDDQYKFKSLLHLISKITKNYHRGPNFFQKIERIIKIFKDDIKKYFSNSEVFHIFKGNKRILLSLIEEQIMVIDKYIINRIISNDKYIQSKYPQYFSIEFKKFQKEKWFPKIKNNIYYSESQKNDWINDLMKELPENFNEMRKIGENHTQICNLIRNDLIKEFLVYIKKNAISLQSKIEPSIYETNSFLIKKQNKLKNIFFSLYQNKDDSNISLIEYAAFFGSIQIFNYLFSNGVELTPSLWICAVHGQNSEIIHILENNHIDVMDTKYRYYSSNQNDEAYVELIRESIKCHHNDIFMYIQNNLLSKNIENASITYIQSIKSYNFALIPYMFINEYLFFFLCQYDYYIPVQILLKEKNIDLNQKIVLLIYFFEWSSK